MPPLQNDPITFRSHHFGFLITLGLLLGVGLALLDQALHSHPGWFIATALIVLLGTRLVSRYAMGSLALCGTELVIYEGSLIIHERTVPIWQASITIQQSLLGRLFDTGTVVVIINERPIHRRVAQLRAFRHLLAERKHYLLILVNRHGPHSSAHPVRSDADGRREWAG